MLHPARRDCGQLRKPCDASADLTTRPASLSASAEEVDSRGARHVRCAEVAQFCCCHFAALAPELSGELRAAWGDVNVVASMIEQLLGGERSVHLDIEPALEFVRLYLHLEGIRTVPAVSLATGLPDAKPRGADASG